jgi:hypothetical protein
MTYTSLDKAQEIYCDESGFTGNNLLDNKTPFFAYATVAVNNKEAKVFVARVIKDYNIQAGELKFQKLIKYSRGRQAITHILKSFSSQAKVSVNNKKYNLACKFYEYIFEPTISSQNSIFYNLNFHKFIAHVLYLHFDQNSDHAEDIFNDFYSMMRFNDDRDLSYIFGKLDLPNISPPLDIIRRFCIHQRDPINAELDRLKGTGVGKWILDLTDSALFSLLCEWGKEFNQLDVFCDTSKPLQENIGIFNAMVERDDKIFVEVAGDKHAMSFNLINAPQMVESKLYPGIQIADIFAGSFCFVCRESSNGNHDAYPKEWTQYLDKCISPYSVMPNNLQHLNIEGLDLKRNYIILEELTTRSEKGIPLLTEIDVFLSQLNYYLYANH